MLPQDLRDLIIDLKDSMELYQNKTAMHHELKYRVVTWWIRYRIKKDVRYASFLILH